MAGGKFKLDELRLVAQEVSKKGRYPINDPDELVKALGGESATLTHGGKGHKVAEVRQIPPETFPIESEDDFIAKLATLRARGGDEAEGLPRGKQLGGPPSGSAPPFAVPQSELLPRGKGGYKGWK